MSNTSLGVLHVIDCDLTDSCMHLLSIHIISLFIIVPDVEDKLQALEEELV